MWIGKQEHLNYFFLRKWELMCDLDNKLADSLQVSLCKEFLDVDLGPLQVCFLEGDETFTYRGRVIFVHKQAWLAINKADGKLSSASDFLLRVKRE